MSRNDITIEQLLEALLGDGGQVIVIRPNDPQPEEQHSTIEPVYSGEPPTPPPLGPFDEINPVARGVVEEERMLRQEATQAKLEDAELKAAEEFMEAFEGLLTKGLVEEKDGRVEITDSGRASVEITQAMRDAFFLIINTPIEQDVNGPVFSQLVEFERSRGRVRTDAGIRELETGVMALTKAGLVTPHLYISAGEVRYEPTPQGWSWYREMEGLS